MSGHPQARRSRALNINRNDSIAIAKNTTRGTEQTKQIDHHNTSESYTTETYGTPKEFTTEEFGEWRTRKDRRLRTNSLTGIIDLEEEGGLKNKEEYKIKRKLMSPGSEEREIKRMDHRKDTEQEKENTPMDSTPFGKSSITKRTPQEQENMPGTGNKADEDEQGTEDGGIKRDEWNNLMSLVQKFAKDIDGIKMINESIQKEQIRTREEQTETRKEIEDMKKQTEKKSKETEEKYKSLEKRTEMLEKEIKDRQKVIEESVKEVIEKNVEERFNSENVDTSKQGKEWRRELENWKINGKKTKDSGKRII